MLLPETELRIVFAQRNCNWIQAMEGDVDTSHFGFLHLGGLDPNDVPENQIGRWCIADRAPELELAETRYGIMYGAWRGADANRRYWRVGHFLFPFWTMPPTGPIEANAVVRGWVPMDDTHTMFVSLMWTRTRQSLGPRKDGTPVPGHVSQLRHRPNGAGWFERWRLADDESNDFGQDRALQKNGSYTGIVGIHLQDQAITESMGPVTDFAFEHLAPSDAMVTRTRRLLLQAARAHHKSGALPPGVRDPRLSFGARGGEFLADARHRLAEAYRGAVEASTDPTGRLLAAAE
jgi:hypothetical protein